IVGIAPLQELTAETMTESAHLFEIKPAARFYHHGGRFPSRVYVAPNPPFGATIHYYLGARADGPVRVVITDAHGNTLAEFPGDSEPGLHHVQWDLKHKRREETEAALAAGEYSVKLHVGKQFYTRKLRIEAEE